MADPFIAQIILFAGNFAPRGWAYCEGQLIAIAQNNALFSLLGTTYGGDGRSTFALPDLRGRVPVQQGNGPGLHTWRLGQRGGKETTELTINELPSHNHQAVPAPSVATMHGDGTGADENSPLDGVPGQAANNIYSSNAPGVTFSPDTISVVPGKVDILNRGGSRPFSNIQPTLALNYIIAMTGTYPSRS